MSVENRLGIYHIYDEEGIADDYILYLLNRISKYLKKLYIVCNGEMNCESLDKLKSITEEVIIRENKGFDAGGFKYTLIEVIGWERLSEYDELLLFNDSFFGPIDSFDEVFEKMDRKEVDFWTLTCSKGNDYSEVSIQSYFINIKKTLLISEDFRNYWENIPYYDSFADAVLKYEKGFAGFFVNKGYTWEAFVNNRDYFYKENDYGISPYHNLQYEIMFYQKYPVLKRKILSLDINSDSYGTDRQGKEQISQAMEFINNEKKYETKLIWKNILRCYALRGIQESCCLRKVLSNSEVSFYNENEAILFLALRNRNINHDNLKRLRDKNIHIILMSDSVEMLQKIEESSHFISKEIYLALSVTDVIRIIYTVLTKLHYQYKYCGFMSDFYWKKEEIPYTVGASKLWEDWENIVGKERYINNIIKTFEENKECGLLVSPRPFHSYYFGEMGKEIEFKNIKCNDFIDENGLKKYISRSNKRAWWSNSFWTKTELLKNVIENINKKPDNIIESWEEFDEYCMILPYWYQKEGYYTQVICSTTFVENRFTIEEACMETMIRKFKKIGKFHTYMELLQILKLYFRNVEKIQDFKKTHNKIYIYGAGGKAEMISRLCCIEGFESFVVSDGQKKCDVLNGHSVKYLSEIKLEIGDGIILGLNKNNTEQVIKFLDDINIKADMLQIDDGGIFDKAWLDFSIE